MWALGGTDASGMPVLEVERLDGLRVANHAGAESPGSYSVAVRMHTH